ncbi:MAG: NAD(P)-dependent oxidoreductase [Candidatus Nanoarchaeia archaeon]|nr:NAD(P)-dependent oxidoreductase [Candidatus Nanoarchaeia archaeon]
MKKILVTGSKGRVGKDIVEFLKNKYEILEFEKGHELNDSLFDVDAVIHLAALTPRKEQEYQLDDYIETNVELTKKILFYSSRNNVKTVIIPMSWSWMFKIGNYQYSKLLQEKFAEKYKKLGLKVIIIEFPEVINSSYRGIISNLVERIKNGQETTVDSVSISTISTDSIAKVFIEFIEQKNQEAEKIYRDLTNTFNLYEKVREIIEKESPKNLVYLKKGKIKIRNPVVNKDNTISFPEFEKEE